MARGGNLRVPLLCRLDEIPDPGAVSVVIGEGPEALDVIVLRWRGHVFAYRNACPHQGTPLETFPGRFFDRERRHLVCSTHGARFEPRDGRCVAGPCRGAALEPVAIALDGGLVRLAADEAMPALEGS